MTTETALDLRARADAAYAQQEEEWATTRAEAARERAEEQAQALAGLLAAWGITVVQPAPELTVDGITLRAQRRQNWQEYATRSDLADPLFGWFIEVQGECLACGQTCWSTSCYSIENVGSHLREFSPNGDHKEHCPDRLAGRTRERSTAEQLADLIVQLVRENGPAE